MRRLVIVRPEPGAGATLGSARALGIDAVAVPLFRVEPVAWEAPDNQFDAMLMTSANAVRHGGDQLRHYRRLPVHAVGEATAAAARDAGFAVASSGEGGVDHLLGGIDPALAMLHPCGADRTAPKGARQTITPVVVYRSVALPDPTTDMFRDAAVAIHSVRAAARLASLDVERGRTDLVALSAAVAAAAGGGWRSICVADIPTDDALLALAKQLCDTERRP